MDCVVVGAGIGGVAAALALAQRGHGVEVWEQAEALGEVGAGLQLGPNAVKVLRALGVAPPADAPLAIEMRDDRSGRRIAEIPLNPGIEARFGAPYWQLHRADLLAALVEAAEAAGVAFRLGQRVEGVPEAALVVGADGVRSELRAHVTGPSEPVFTGQMAWRGVIAGADMPKAWARRTQLCLGPGRHLVAYPLRGGALWNFVAVRERADWRAEGWSLRGDPEDLRIAFADAAPEIRRFLDQVEETFLWGLFGHPPLERWHSGHVVLVGDACHPMLPFLAQGAAMAIEDAWVLAACLEADAGGLERYRARRFSRATRVQRSAAGNARIYHMAHPLLRWGLHTGIGLRAALPGGLLGRYGWLYGADVTANEARG
ncbi:MAG: FAD-dependent monooxygenase [Pseudomonadota bacterium]